MEILNSMLSDTVGLLTLFTVAVVVIIPFVIYFYVKGKMSN